MSTPRANARSSAFRIDGANLTENITTIRITSGEESKPRCGLSDLAMTGGLRRLGHRAMSLG
jgi:hypothetical protein